MIALSEKHNDIRQYENELKFPVMVVVMQVVGHARPVTIADKPALPFVEATMMEVLRMSNTGDYSLLFKSPFQSYACIYKQFHRLIVSANKVKLK